MRIGEASHGTHEYYEWRALLSRRLITEHGVTWVGVEGDWPDCWRLNRWARGETGQELDARGVLAWLEDHFPEALPAALQAWQCFVPYREHPHEYARSTRIVPENFEADVVTLLTEVRRSTLDRAEGDPAALDAALNAMVAVGVVYDPRREAGNNVPTRLGERYDALFWFEGTSALRPLHHEEPPEEPEPETEPTGY